MQPVVQVPQPTGQVSKRSLFKKKAGMTTVQANALKNAQTPADRLRAELENERKAVITRDFRDSLRNQLRELQHLKERVMNQQEISIIVEESKRLRYEVSACDPDKPLLLYRCSPAISGPAFGQGQAHRAIESRVDHVCQRLQR